MSLYLPIAAAVIGIVIVLAVAFALRWRYRPGRPVSSTSNNPVLEGICALVIAGIVVVLLARTFPTEAKVDRVSAKPSLIVRVTAARWHWIFDYDRLGIHVTGTDKSWPELTVPADRTIRFSMTSADVIHAFWIPDLRFKKDAMPGRVVTFDLAFPKPGEFPDGGTCSEFCGLHHDSMRFRVRVLEPAAFQRWAAANGTTP